MLWFYDALHIVGPNAILFAICFPAVPELSSNYTEWKTGLEGQCIMLFFPNLLSCFGFAPCPFQKA